MAPSGIISTVATLPGGMGDMIGPVALDGADAVYTTTGSSWAPQVVRLDASGPVVVAGNGTRGSGGDGGPATAAPLNPIAITFDRSGNLYVADHLTRRIRRVERAGAPAPEVHSSGYNATGQLGTGGVADRRVPAGVDRMAGTGGVAAGAFHTLATRADGSVWSWGWNAYGQLGNGTTDTSYVPRRVNGLGGVKAVAAGAYHSLALGADGTVWAWAGTASARSATGPPSSGGYRSGCPASTTSPPSPPVPFTPSPSGRTGPSWRGGTTAWASSGTAPPPTATFPSPSLD